MTLNGHTVHCTVAYSDCLVALLVVYLIIVS